MGRAREWVGRGWGCLLLFGGGTGGAGIDLFNRFHGLTEDIETELLKLGMGKRLQKVISVIKRLKACGLVLPQLDQPRADFKSCGFFRMRLH